MREILFRGKRQDNGEWVEGYYGQFHNRPTVNEPNSHQIFEPKENAVPFGSVIGGLWHIVIPETVGQYTGLTDKNGTKIFEGDKVNVNTNKDTLCHRYEGRNLVIEFDEYHRFIANGRLSYPLCNHYEWEVIGNIHDRPTEKGGVE